jgi:Domain of unknown function (DUF5122) beta-propeller
MNPRYRATAIVLLLTVQRLACAGIGDVDPSYGLNGRVLGSLVPLPDGQAIEQTDIGYRRIDTFGHPDAGFGNQGVQVWPAGFAPNWDARLRLQDGSTLLGGWLGTAAAVVRVDRSGSVDANFAGNGVLSLPTRLARSQVLGLALQPGGQLLVLTGEFYDAFYFDTPVQVLVRRFTQSLASDPTFGDHGEMLVADYRLSTDSSFPYTETAQQKLTVLRDGAIAFTDQYSQVSLNLFGRFGVRRVPYLAVNGLPSSQPMPDPILDTAVSDWRMVSPLADGGALVDGFVSSIAGTHYRLVRLRATGQPDMSFGFAGSYTLDDEADRRPTLGHVSADGRFFYLAQEGDRYTSVTRIWLQGPTSGQVDISFGQGGVVRIWAPLGLKALQAAADGSVLLAGANSTFRLLGTALPSPGIISLNTPLAAVSQAGLFAVQATRSAGSDGPVSVDFSTMTFASAGTPPAVAGTDFLPLNGTLTWADGESAAKTLNVTILPFYVQSGADQRLFAMQLQNLTGGTWIEIPLMNMYNDSSSSGPATPTSASSGSQNSVAPAANAGAHAGGGGALDLVSLLALGAAISRRANSRARRIAALPRR